MRGYLFSLSCQAETARRCHFLYMWGSAPVFVHDFEKDLPLHESVVRAMVPVPLSLRERIAILSRSERVRLDCWRNPMPRSIALILAWALLPGLLNAGLRSVPPAVDLGEIRGGPPRPHPLPPPPHQSPPLHPTP